MNKFVTEIISPIPSVSDTHIADAANPTRNYTTARDLSIKIKSILPYSCFYSQIFTLDAALRKFLLQFCLTEETKDKERVLLHFSYRFLESKPWRNLPVTRKQLIPATERKLPLRSLNLPELNDGHNFPEKLLEVYLAIKTELIQWVQDKSA